ncbi:unnamed protein product [Urochloa humidicola]
MFCNVAAVVSPRVVIVEDKKHGGYCSGSVIHKTPEDTYILTQQRVIQADSMFLVHFSNKTQEYARVLVQGTRFAILSLGRSHPSCNVVHFSNPTKPSEALTIVPKNPNDPSSLSVFEFIRGYVPKTSWVSAAGNAPPGTAIPGSESYFMATCHHGNTQMMVSLPVFNMSCEAYGVVVSDCRSKKRGSDSRPQKICINGTTVENELKVMLNEEDWKGALSKISKKANPRKRKYHHVQPRVKAIRP